MFYMTSPFDENMTLYRKEWFEGVTVVATVYDIIPYMRKEQYFPRFSRAKQYYEMRIDMLKWVDQILVISESVKAGYDQIHEFCAGEDRCHLGCGR